MSLPRIQLPQKLEFLRHPQRYKVAYGGRGSTKSWTFGRQALIEGSQRPKRILCVREIQRTIADSVHQLLVDQIASMDMGGFYNVTDTEITGINGTRVAFAGLRGIDANKLKSFEGVDICWVEEANAVVKRSWNVLTPTIRKPGSEIWVTFNPELDTDETYKRFVVKPPLNSTVVKVSWRDNPWFTKELEGERLDLKARDPDAYDNVWEGNCRASVEGAIYARRSGKRSRESVCSLPYDPTLKVHTIWDLGYIGMSVIMVQKVATSLAVIDYLEADQTTYAEIINGSDRIQGLNKRGYRWGTDYLPHDSKSHNPQTGKSAYETLEKLGRTVDTVPDIGVEEGIRAAKQMFPQVYFDDLKAETLFHHLQRYRRRINVSTEAQSTPLHDAHSHGSDAFRYMAVIAESLTNDELGKFNPMLGWQ